MQHGKACVLWRMLSICILVTNETPDFDALPRYLVAESRVLKGRMQRPARQGRVRVKALDEKHVLRCHPVLEVPPMTRIVPNDPRLPPKVILNHLSPHEVRVR